MSIHRLIKSWRHRLRVVDMDRCLACARKLIGDIPESVLVTDPQGRPMFANQAFQTLVGKDDNRPGIPAEFQAAFQEALARWAGSGFHRQHLDLPFPNHQHRSLDLTVTSLWAKGTEAGLPVFMLRDVSHRLDLEKHVQVAQQLESIGVLTAGLSEELNRELNLLLRATEDLRPHIRGALPITQAVGNIFQAALSSANISRQLLSLSHQSQEASLPLDLSNLVHDAAHLMRLSAPPGITVHTQIMSAVWVSGIPGRLQQALLNLAFNAFDAMGEGGGTLTLTLGETHKEEQEAEGMGLDTGRHALLTVADTGCGMPPATLQRVFEPFFTTKPPEKGIGLGLTQVASIVAQHRGSIEVESQPGQGTRFHIHLPCSLPLIHLGPDGSHPSEALRGSEHVLLVDPSIQDTTVAKLGLESLGYQVDVVADPTDALNTFREDHRYYDIAVVELLLPRMGGMDVAHRLRHIRRNLPIILATSLPNPPAAIFQLHTEVAGIYEKPYDLARFAACLRKHLPPPLPAEAEQAPFSPATGTVLLADDSAVTRSMVRAWLAQSGFQVLEARDGQDAWELYEAQGQGVDLLLSDLVMPRMDGLELARRARAADAQLPIVIMTTVEDRETVKAALHAGVNDFLNKPFQREVLLECTQRLLSAQKERHAARKSLETAQAVRLAQRALLAVPEKDLPLYTLYEPLADAGGDVFRAQRNADGSIFFVLGDVAGHSVISSYAVAAFLGMLTTFNTGQEDLGILAMRLNTGIQEGPFAEVPVCTLLGRWEPHTGRLSLLNAGIPHGVIYRKALEQAEPIPLNGTPLGILPHPILGETVVHLFEGDRLLFGTDGFFDVLSAEHQLFESRVASHWAMLRDSPMQWALSLVCEAARAHGEGLLSDDLLVVGFEQGALMQPEDGFLIDIPSNTSEIDKAILLFKSFLDESEKGRVFPETRRFDLGLVLREALTNALFHGNRNQPQARIKLQCSFEHGSDRLAARVADQGKGFLLADHSAPTDIHSERGRGIPLIRHFAQSVAMAGCELSLIFTPEGPDHGIVQS